MSHPLDFSDGVETYRYRQEDGRLYRVHTSCHEDAIMAENAAIRANGGARKMDWAKPIIRLSVAQYRLLVKLKPELASRDGHTCRLAWERLARDLDYSKLWVT
jgi:hypothetical protein